MSALRCPCGGIIIGIPMPTGLVDYCEKCSREFTPEETALLLEVQNPEGKLNFICANCGAIACEETEHSLESGSILVCDECKGETTVLLCTTEEYSIACEAIKKDPEGK